MEGTPMKVQGNMVEKMSAEYGNLDRILRCRACGKMHRLLLRGFNEAHADGVAEVAERRYDDPLHRGEATRAPPCSPLGSDRPAGMGVMPSAAAHPLRANLPDRGSEPRVARNRVTTALAVLPTNRPMSRSKLTDHSSDPES